MFLLAGVLPFLLVAEAVTQNASFSGAQGVIYSPGYPDNYANQLNQYYTITAPDPGYFVHLTLYDFETEACCDKLYIWDGADTSAATLANVSGDATGMTFSSSGSIMTLLFNTDITGQERGFAIHYEMVQKDTQYSESSTCQSGLFTSGLGFVTSPNWPSNYPNDITCNYLMTMPKGSRLVLTFVAFSTEACCDKVEIYDGPNATYPKLAVRLVLTFVAFSTEACCDKVEIYDGPNATYPKLAVLSGSSVVNTTYYSTQQSLFLTFYSDYTESDKGFSAYYKQIVDSRKL
ncbi:CUB domain protein [Cooperia oncophora]